MVNLTGHSVEAIKEARCKVAKKISENGKFNTYEF